MIDAPIALVLVGSALQAAAPAGRIASGLRVSVNAILTRARMIEDADAALARDPLITGIAGITEIYSRG